MSTLERKIIEKKTESGIAVSIKEYITARERQPLQNILYSQVNASKLTSKTTDASEVLDSMDSSLFLKYNHGLVEVFVVSINGNEENVGELALDLPSTDYDEIVSWVSEMISPKK